MEFEALTYKIIGAGMEVHSLLGPGFLESIYKNALMHELRLRGVEPRTEVDLCIKYKDRTVGRHRIDIIADNAVIIELKAVSAINDLHIAQALSYLKAKARAGIDSQFRRSLIIVEKAD